MQVMWFSSPTAARASPNGSETRIAKAARTESVSSLRNGTISFPRYVERVQMADYPARSLRRKSELLEGFFEKTQSGVARGPGKERSWWAGRTLLCKKGHRLPAALIL